MDHGDDADGDEEEDAPSPSAAVCCSCDCPYCGSAFRRSMKRRLDLAVALPLLPPLPHLDSATARVEAEIELSALRETVANHQQSVRDLYVELEEERSSAATAASEAMSMILRLQREKAEAQMEARQFRRLVDEKMAHDQREIAALEDLLCRRDQAIQSLSAELQALRRRLSAYEPQTPATPEIHPYPALRCSVPTMDSDADGGDDVAFVDTPRDWTPSSNVMEKGVVEYFSFNDFPLDADREDIGDRVYTVDAVHGGAACDDCLSTPRAFGGGDGGEMKKLYMRLQALEADRESMRRAIASMGAERAQVALLREIAQQLRREVPVEKKVVKKPSIQRFSIGNAVKWFVSFVFRRKKAAPCRYTFGLSGSNVGLLLLLEKSPLVRQQKCLTRTR